MGDPLYTKRPPWPSLPGHHKTSSTELLEGAGVKQPQELDWKRSGEGSGQKLIMEG